MDAIEEPLGILTMVYGKWKSVQHWDMKRCTYARRFEVIFSFYLPLVLPGIQSHRDEGHRRW